jgi:hypothetical protein
VFQLCCLRTRFVSQGVVCLHSVGFTGSWTVKVIFLNVSRGSTLFFICIYHLPRRHVMSDFFLTVVFFDNLISFRTHYSFSLVYLQQNKKGRKPQGKKCHTKTVRACLNRIYFRRKCKLEHCFCTEILSQIVIWYKKDDVTKKNRLSHVTSCLEIVTKKACLFEVRILDRKHALLKKQTFFRFLQQVAPVCNNPCFVLPLALAF